VCSIRICGDHGEALIQSWNVGRARDGSLIVMDTSSAAFEASFKEFLARPENQPILVRGVVLGRDDDNDDDNEDDNDDDACRPS
jgi:hypothetical protein